jgi:hypothetical protein
MVIDLSDYYFSDDKLELQNQGYFDFHIKGIIVH